MRSPRALVWGATKRTAAATTPARSLALPSSGPSPVHSDCPSSRAKSRRSRMILWMRSLSFWTRERNSKRRASGRSVSRASSTSPAMAVSGLPISCATPAARRPTLARWAERSTWRSADSRSRVVRSSSSRRATNAARSSASCSDMALKAPARRATSAAPRTGTRTWSCPRATRSDAWVRLSTGRTIR